jgi:hypothetical protein
MGREATCRATIAGEEAEKRVLLESDELVVCGRPRVRIPFAEVTDVTAANGRLEVGFRGERASFELGREAERWAERIRHPPTLVDKLDLKPGARVSILGVGDETFAELVSSRAGNVAVGTCEPGSDAVFVQVDAIEDLRRIGSLEPSLARDGSIWVISPKGRADLRESDVLEAGRAAGFVDTKVARFSETHTAHKFVIPKERR